MPPTLEASASEIESGKCEECDAPRVRGLERCALHQHDLLKCYRRTCRVSHEVFLGCQGYLEETRLLSDLGGVDGLHLIRTDESATADFILLQPKNPGLVRVPEGWGQMSALAKRDWFLQRHDELLGLPIDVKFSGVSAGREKRREPGQTIYSAAPYKKLGSSARDRDSLLFAVHFFDDPTTVALVPAVALDCIVWSKHVGTATFEAGLEGFFVPYIVPRELLRHALAQLMWKLLGKEGADPWPAEDLTAWFSHLTLRLAADVGSWYQCGAQRSSTERERVGSLCRRLLAAGASTADYNPLQPLLGDFVVTL